MLPLQPVAENFQCNTLNTPGFSDITERLIDSLHTTIQQGIHFISRLRKDAVAWDDPSPEQRADAKRGRKWKLAQLLEHLPAVAVTVLLYGKQVTVRAVSRVVWLRDVEQKVQVVVIEGLKEPILLVCTDLALTMAQIIEIYAARFPIEMAIRDLKQYFGIADYQCYRGAAIHRFVHLSCVAFCVYRLIQFRAPAWLPAVPRGVSPASFAHLRSALRRHLVKRILAPDSGERPEVKARPAELEAVLRITA